MPDWAVEGCMEQWRLQLQGEAEAREARAELRRKGISAPWVPFVLQKSSSSSPPKSADPDAECGMDQWPLLLQGEAETREALAELKRKVKVVSKRPPTTVRPLPLSLSPIKPIKPAKPANPRLWSQHDKDLLFKTFPDHVAFSKTVFETIRGQLERDCNADTARRHRNFVRWNDQQQQKKKK
jgi:hypothetical protein